MVGAWLFFAWWVVGRTTGSVFSSGATPLVRFESPPPHATDPAATAATTALEMARLIPRIPVPPEQTSARKTL